jgi:hypothetical protein
MDFSALFATEASSPLFYRSTPLPAVEVADMQALARLERVEGRSRRAASRLKLSLGTVLPSTGEEVVIHDLSATGILIQTNAALKAADKLEVELPEVGATVAQVVWNSGDYFGCQFDTPIAKAALSAALLRNPFEPFAESSPAADASYPESEGTAEFDDDRASFAVRMRVILGTSLALWALILWAISRIW